jgi:hypothetical protein
VPRVDREFDLPAVLTELLYGDESTEPLERTLDRLVTPDFVQRINGRVYRRPEYDAHVREMRQLVTGGGEMRVLEQTGMGTAIAGRYLFRMVSAAGQSVTFESHLFARITDGRAERFVEVSRQIEDGDDRDLLTGS